MSIRLSCPLCRSKLRAPDHSAGRKGSCPNCGGRIALPAPRQADGAWYFRNLLSSDVRGPVTFVELLRRASAREIGPYTRVWRDAGEWSFAYEVRGLFDHFARAVAKSGA